MIDKSSVKIGDIIWRIDCDGQPESAKVVEIQIADGASEPTMVIRYVKDGRKAQVSFNYWYSTLPEAYLDYLKECSNGLVQAERQLNKQADHLIRLAEETRRVAKIVQEFYPNE